MSIKQSVKSVFLESDHLRATVISTGASLKSLVLKKPDSCELPLVWDLGHVDAYRPNPSHVGSVVGRVSGRIAEGRFKLGTHTYQLLLNDHGNTLHGGPQGFAQLNWQWTREAMFALFSPNGDQGFPGAVDLRATYSMPEPLTLRLDFQAHAQQTTPVDLTHHPYWALFGSTLKICGNRYQSVDQALIPTGGTSLFVGDLTTALDHCVKIEGQGFRKHAQINHMKQGFAMEVWSDAPYCQVYNGQNGFICLEPQSANDAVNQSDVPDILLNPGEIWTRRIEYRVRMCCV